MSIFQKFPSPATMAKLDVAFIDGEGRRAYGVLVASIHEVVSGIVERSYDHILAEAVDELWFFRVGFD